jgi:hypothetical protein
MFFDLVSFEARNEGDSGECRRLAPRMPAYWRPELKSDPWGEWPVVLVDSWCGEFKKRWPGNDGAT